MYMYWNIAFMQDTRLWFTSCVMIILLLSTIQSFIHSFIYSLIHPYIHSSIHPSIQSFGELASVLLSLFCCLFLSLLLFPSLSPGACWASRSCWHHGHERAGGSAWHERREGHDGTPRSCREYQCCCLCCLQDTPEAT